MSEGGKWAGFGKGATNWAPPGHTQGPVGRGICDPVYAYFSGTIMAPS